MQVAEFVQKVIYLDQSDILTPDYVNNQPYYGAVLVHLAYQSATTFRYTDFLGGANGARIRFPPQSMWPSNIAMDKTLHLLQPVQQAFRNLSWADLIVFSGNVALVGASYMSPTNFPFCPGRTDASDGTGSAFLQPNTNYSATIEQMHRAQEMMRLDDEETVVLSARLRSPAQMGRMGYYGTWSTNISVLSNQYFITLLAETWQPYMVTGSGNLQYKAMGKELYMVQTDMNLIWDPTYLAYVQNFAADINYFLTTFSAAWTKIMNIDRFAGPAGNLCNSMK
jgi:catalase (peroxidase I)